MTNTTKSETSIKPLQILESKQAQSLKDVLIVLAALLVTIIGLQYVAQGLLAPILLALFFTALMHPVFRWFRGRGFSSGGSLTLMLLSVTVGVAAFMLLLAWAFALMGSAVSASVNQAISQVQTNLDELFGIESITSTALGTIDAESVFSLVASVVGSIATALIYLVVVLIIAMLMLLQMDKIPQVLVAELSTDNPMIGKMSKFFHAISAYMVSRLKVNTISGILALIAFLIIGIPYAYLWAFLIIILSFIPYIGLIIASIPPVLLAYSQGGLVEAVVVGLAIGVIILFTENVVDPYVQGKQTRISTAAIVISLLLWTWLLGPVGALLSTPLTVLLKLILEDYKETRWLALMMEGSYEQSKSEMKTAKPLWRKAGGWLSQKAQSGAQRKENS